MKTHIFTRKELYDLVWQMPMTKLSKQVGLSDQGLAKLCKRYEIPLPIRGYWAKLAAGKQVEQTPLPDNNDKSISARITITKTKFKQSAQAANVVETLARTALPEITVPTKLHKPHPAVQHWIEDYENSICREQVILDRMPKEMRQSFIATITELDKRRYLLMDTIFKAIEKFGYRVNPGGHRTTWEALYNGTQVKFDITERSTQLKRPLAAVELAKSEASDKTHVIKRHATGLLMFKIKTDLPKGLKSRWEEDDNQSLEQLLPEIVQTLQVAGPLLVQESREREAARKLDLEERIRVFQENMRLEADRKCWDRFLEASFRSSQSQGARALIKRIEEMAKTQDMTKMVGKMTLSEWITWSNAWAEDHDPLSGDLSGLFEEVSTVKSDRPWHG